MWKDFSNSRVKLLAVKAVMIARPEAEWFWWIDSDESFIVMEFMASLHYRYQNLVVYGWPSITYVIQSWIVVNAKVFHIRNCQWSMEVAKKNKETYLQAMEEYKRTKEEEAMSQKKEEEELLKLHKQEALQLLKKKEKTDNLIKKEKETKKKKNENVDPNKPKKPASSFILFSKDARKALTEERPGTSNSTVTALISVKWKELGEEEKQSYNNKAAKLMEAYKKELEDYNKKSAAATTSS
ncbi:hypothetical protein F2Q70_00034979 [Brassica cretica]|uniref:HMG box domain-containing protein n=1 Tax=Brassica cretica TaxID=69181 RepID=A0A8S9JTZ8_BRACR|nr:hypothetical protein F2Q70_00034979 [Brassica cretica]